jgi:acetyl-CoA acyltransferase
MPPDSSLEGLSTLATPFKEGGKVTAGNASQISDGSAAPLMTTSEFAAAHGLRALARIHTAVVIGAAPMPTLTAPIPATEKALKKSGLKLHEIGAFEVNEAFASVPMAWLKETGADIKLTNAARRRYRTRAPARRLGRPHHDDPCAPHAR